MIISIPLIGRLSIEKATIAIIIVWLFQLSAIIGILLGKADWFLSKTPFTLSLYTILCFWIFPFKNLKLIGKSALIVSLGFLSEWLGVNHLSIFGDYEYGKNFGMQFQGTPLLIGFNWLILALISNSIMSCLLKSKYLIILMAAALMVLLDVSMELVADQFGFWHFSGGIPPLRNYLSWFAIGVIMQLILSGSNFKAQFTFSLNHYLANLAFFGFFAFYFYFDKA